MMQGWTDEKEEEPVDKTEVKGLYNSTVGTQ